MSNWAEVLKEIANSKTKEEAKREQKNPFDFVRHKYLDQLHKHVDGRNIIAYYSGFLSKPGLPLLEINDEDKNGFMMAVHQLDRSKGLDLILHTPGGQIAPTQSIVDYLRKMFNGDIRAIIPQIAMSAGTMMACSCHTILMGAHSNLGPIDPHVRGLPAYGIIAEFKKVAEEIKRDPSRIALWQPILSKYYPTFLSECENAIAWSNSFVEQQLAEVMFKRKRNKVKLSKQVVNSLADYEKNKTHGRHIHFDDCKKMGLNVVKIEEDQKLQDLILTVHHCYMHSLMNTSVFKIIENHKGVCFAKQQLTVGIPQPQIFQPNFKQKK